MNPTINSVLCETLTKYFSTTVSTHLSEWLKENKDFEITPEELCTALDVPFFYYPEIRSKNTRNLNNLFDGTGISGGKRRSGRQKIIPDPNAPKCKYVFKRGNRKNKICKQPCDISDKSIVGSDKYCKSCLKKTAVKEELKKDDNNKVLPPKDPHSTVSSGYEETEETLEVDVIALPGGRTIEPVNNFILVKEEDDVIAVSKMDEGVERELSPEEKNIASMCGYSYIEN